MNRQKIFMTMHVFEACRKPLFAVLDGISDEQLAWKPAPESRSIGEICRHLLRVDAWYLKRLGIEPVVSDVKSGSREDLVANMQKIQHQIAGVVEVCTNDDDLLIDHKSLDGKDKEKLGVAVIHIAQHYLYHLAQIIYFRRAQDRNWQAPTKAWEEATHVIGDYLLGLK
ncbi:MAG: DinB family protein [bacterium]